MIRTSHDLPQDTREQIVDLLNQQLADTFDLYSQVKQAHWNVKGPEFAQLHELYDQVAGAVLPFVDEIAERATALGGVARGTVRMAGANSGLAEIADGPLSGGTSIEAVTIGLASLAASTRAAIGVSGDAGDEGTADLFTALSRELDKLLWFVEAHTQTA
jgi:starvation-inducible DNA-binding protein